MANNNKTKAEKFVSISNREVVKQLVLAANVILSALRSGKKPKNLGPFLDSWFRTRMHNFDPTQNVDNYGLEHVLVLLAKDSEVNKIKSFYKRSVDSWLKYKTRRKKLEESLLKNFIFVSEVVLVREDFDIQTIFKAKNPDEQYDLLKQFIVSDDQKKKIGIGTSRIVIEMPSGNTVLKAAMSQKGIEQNKIEIQLSQNSVASLGLAKVINSAADGRWVVSEKATALTSKDDFIDLVGLTPYTLYNAIAQNNLKYLEHSLTPNGIKIAKALEAILQLVDFYEPDLKKLDSWGVVTRDGKKYVVLIDYGITHDIVRNYYPELLR